MYAAPLGVMRQVLRTKSVQFMPLPLSAMSFVNCVVWSVYSFYVQDVYIGVPNYLGVLFTAAQVCAREKAREARGLIYVYSGQSVGCPSEPPLYISDWAQIF
jgi:solute carrier family 50 protein (sugar transporter)